MKMHSKAGWLIDNCGDAEANCKKVGRWLEKEVKCARVGNRRAGWLERIQQRNNPITEEIKRKKKSWPVYKMAVVWSVLQFCCFVVVIIEEFLMVAIFHLQISSSSNTCTVYNRIHLTLWASTCMLTPFQSQMPGNHIWPMPSCPGDDISFPVTDRHVSYPATKNSRINCTKWCLQAMDSLPLCSLEVSWGLTEGTVLWLSHRPFIHSILI